jgi:hypothetical protein
MTFPNARVLVGVFHPRFVLQKPFVRDSEVALIGHHQGITGAISAL